MIDYQYLQSGYNIHLQPNIINVLGLVQQKFSFVECVAVLCRSFVIETNLKCKKNIPQFA